MSVTPGPWVWSRNHGICRVGEPPYPLGESVLYATYEWESGCDIKVSDDNLKLILAAPDLLLAVKCLCEEMADYMKINNLGDPNEKHNYRLGMAAIAKAEPQP